MPLGEDVGGDPFGITELLEVDAELDKLPEVYGAGDHIPVPVAVVVIDMNMEQPPGRAQERQRIAHHLQRLQRMAGIQRDAHIVQTDLFTQVGHLARVAQQAVNPGLGELVLQAELYIRAVCGSLTHTLHRVVESADEIQLKRVIRTVVQKGDGDLAAAELGRVIQTGFHVLDRLGADLRVRAADRAIDPFGFALDIHVHRRDAHAIVIQNLLCLDRILYLLGVYDLQAGAALDRRSSPDHLFKVSGHAIGRKPVLNLSHKSSNYCIFVSHFFVLS